LLFKKLGIEPTINPAIGVFLSLKDKFLLSLLSLQIVIFGPIAEELFFRGFLYRWIRGDSLFLSQRL
jgi:membrane protease YdiL (CAAX protease family)